MANNGWTTNVKTECAICGKTISGIGLCNLCWKEWTCTGTVQPAWLYGTGTVTGLLAMHSSYVQRKSHHEILILDLPEHILRKI